LEVFLLWNHGYYGNLQSIFPDLMQSLDSPTGTSPFSEGTDLASLRPGGDDGVGFALAVVGTVVLLLILTAVAADWVDRYV